MTERIRKFLLDTNWTRAAVIALVALGAVAWFQACLNQRTPTAPMPPTDTPTPFVSTHVPSRTLTATEEPTWTNTPTKVVPTIQPESTLTPTSTPTLTLTASASPTPTPTQPTLTPTVGLITTPGRNVLPNTGASAQDIADMTATATPTSEPTPLPTPKRITLDEGCVLHSVLLEVGAGYDTLTFHCPSVLKGVKPQGVGKVD